MLSSLYNRKKVVHDEKNDKIGTKQIFNVDGNQVNKMRHKFNLILFIKI